MVCPDLFGRRQFGCWFGKGVLHGPACFDAGVVCRSFDTPVLAHLRYGRPFMASMVSDLAGVARLQLLAAGQGFLLVIAAAQTAIVNGRGDMVVLAHGVD